MLRSLYVIFDYHIAASDGVLGRVKDFLFDDESWIVHYLVAEIAAEPGTAKVLIPPFVVGEPDWKTKILPVLLTCEQIRASPLLESDIPISLQRQSGLKRPGSHLRSMQEILGYSIHTMDGEGGSIEDFIIEDRVWDLHHVVVSLKRFPHRLVLLPPKSIRSISWPGKAAWVNLSLGELEKCPDFWPSSPVNEPGDGRHYDFYGRPIDLPLPWPHKDRREATQQ